MKINESVFSDKTGPWRQRDKDNFLLISRTKIFNKIIIRVRKDIDVDESKFLKSFETAEIYRKTEKPAKQIIEIFDLPESWESGIRWFIATGGITSPGSGIYFSGMALRLNEERGKFLRPNSFRITITEKVGFTTLLKFIKQHRKEIETYLKKLPIRRSANKNPKIDSAIVNLIEKDRTDKEIVNAISNRWPSTAPLEGAIRARIKRVRQRIKGLPLT